MRTLRIDIFHGNGLRREHVRTIDVPVESAKRLTADRARRILVRTLPGFRDPIMHPVDGGYEAQRTYAPLEGCSYHYVWEFALVREPE